MGKLYSLFKDNVIFYLGICVAAGGNYYLSGQTLLDHSVMTTAVCFTTSAALAQYLYDTNKVYSDINVRLKGLAYFLYMIFPTILMGMFISTGRYEGNITDPSDAKTALDTTVVSVMGIIIPTIIHTCVLFYYPLKFVPNTPENSDERMERY